MRVGCRRISTVSAHARREDGRPATKHTSESGSSDNMRTLPAGGVFLCLTQGLFICMRTAVGLQTLFHAVPAPRRALTLLYYAVTIVKHFGLSTGTTNRKLTNSPASPMPVSSPGRCQGSLAPHYTTLYTVRRVSRMNAAKKHRSLPHY